MRPTRLTTTTTEGSTRNVQNFVKNAVATRVVWYDSGDRIHGRDERPDGKPRFRGSYELSQQHTG